MSEANLALVDAFCHGLTAGDFDALLPYLHEDVEYHNMPWAPMTGTSRVREFIEPFLDGTHSRLVRMEIHHQAATGNVVLNARSELWRRDAIEVLLPVAGVFTIENGLIVRWHDYWDAATLKPLLETIGA